MGVNPPETNAPHGHDADGAARAEEVLPLGIRVAAAWSWRLIAIGLALAGMLWLILQVRFLVVPLMVAVLLTALLGPVVDWFPKVGLPRWLGVIVALVVFVASVTALIVLIVTQLRNGVDDVWARSQQSWHVFRNWVDNSPFGIPAEQIDEWLASFTKTINDHQSEIWSGALGVATTAGQFVTGLLLTFFSLIFLLIDGKRIWFWVLGFLPAAAHAPTDYAGRAGWVSVGQYVRVQIFVAFVDAVGIGLGAVLLGVPFPVPIAVMVFLGSFIPFLGAISTGLLAAFIALVYNGPVNAAIMLGVVILVNQLEGHVLQPLVMGNAVRVHPLGVVLGVSAGALLAGIPGALFAVPLVAAANSIVNALVRREWDPSVDPVKEFHVVGDKHKLVRERARRVSKMKAKDSN